MENLIFSLNATMPIFFMMVLGYLFHQIGWIDDVFASKMNTFVFRAALPVMVFENLATVDFEKVWDVRFIFFCFAVTLISISCVIALSFLWKEKSIQGEFIQASYRSSAAILGLAFIQNIYGNSEMGPLMIIGSVPLYNIMAVVVLSVFKAEREGLDKHLLFKTLKGILTNPIIISIFLGMLWSALGLPWPVIFGKVVNNLGKTATPLGLMAMGATFDFKKALSTGRYAALAAFIKLVGFELIFLPIAIRFGFREESLVAIFIMLGSATTVSCYVMARNMNHEGTLTSSVVMLTTLLSGFTLTVGLYILKSLQLI